MHVIELTFLFVYISTAGKVAYTVDQVILRCPIAGSERRNFIINWFQFQQVTTMYIQCSHQDIRAPSHNETTEI